MKLLKLLTLLSALQLTACHLGTRFAYNNLDTLVSVQVGNYVDLEAAQREPLKSAVQQVWDWHRDTQLPAYAQSLTALAAELDKGNLSPAAVAHWLDVIETHSEHLEQEILPALAPLLASLSDPQVDKLLAESGKTTNKWLKKRLAGSAQDRRERLAKRSQERIDDWLGSVNAAQKALTERRVVEAEARGALDSVHLHSEAEQSAQQLSELLATRAKPGFEKRLNLTLHPTEGEAEQERVDDRARVLSYFIALAATLDAEQRRYLSSRLRDYAEDCVALSAKAKTRPAS